MQDKQHNGTWVRSLVSAAMAGAFLAMAHGTMAQATPKPPERMTYQGFLTGADGVALGNTAPRAYDVLFRIFDAEQGGTLLWGEQQTVTVDKGYFSVLLGEGAAVSGVPNAGIVFSSLFTGATASDRFVGVTVKGIGTGGTDVDILPRVRFLSSPYAYLAASAVKLVQTTGADLLTSSGNTVTVSGSLVANGLTAGTITATNSVTAGILTASTNVATPVLMAGAVTVTNALTAGSITTTGTLSVPALSATDLLATALGATTVTATNLNINSSASYQGLGIPRWGHGTRAPRIVVGQYGLSSANNLLEWEDQPEHSVQRISQGRYRITLKTPFASGMYPVCIVTGVGSNPFTFSVSHETTSNNQVVGTYAANLGYFDVHCKYRDAGGWWNADGPFNFIIIGW